MRVRVNCVDLGLQHDMESLNVRGNWPHYFTRACSCTGNYSGVDCSRSKYRHFGANCEKIWSYFVQAWAGAAQHDFAGSRSFIVSSVYVSVVLALQYWKLVLPEPIFALRFKSVCPFLSLYYSRSLSFSTQFTSWFYNIGTWCSQNQYSQWDSSRSVLSSLFITLGVFLSLLSSPLDSTILGLGAPRTNIHCEIQVCLSFLLSLSLCESFSLLSSPGERSKNLGLANLTLSLLT